MEQQMKQTAGIIATAHMKISSNQPDSMRPVGSISAIKRIMMAFLKADVNPIVIITGPDAEVIERELALYSVLFLKTEHDNQSELLKLAQAGIRYLKGKCDQVLFTPANTALFSPNTLNQLIHMNALAAAPSYRQRGGHPILLSSEIFPALLSYSGGGGIPEALHSLGIERQWLEVEDRGILPDLDRIKQDDELITVHNDLLFRPFLRVRLGKETTFMGGRIKLLLSLIDETHSVRKACSHISVSYSKAWNMLNHLEEELGYEVLTRQQGGKNGGKTELTPAGKQFLLDFSTFEANVRQYAADEFERIFRKSQLNKELR
jgi:molybdate transport repressor ModE-like protein